MSRRKTDAMHLRDASWLKIDRGPGTEDGHSRPHPLPGLRFRPFGRMNSVLGTQPPPSLPPPLRDGRGEEIRKGICLRRPSPCGDGSQPRFCNLFSKEGLSAQADRRPQALSPDFNRRAIEHEICVR